MSSTAVTLKTFEREVLASEQPVIVDFWAPWCGPCLAVAPVLQQIVAERHGEVKLVKVNIDEEQQLAGRYGISSIPTIILFKDGNPVAGTIGARRKQHLEKALGLARSPVADDTEAGASRGLFARLARRGSQNA